MLSLLTFQFVCTAGDDVQKKPETAQNSDGEQPSMEMLEFLGNWETDNGEWIDPNEFKYMFSLEQEKKG